MAFSPPVWGVRGQAAASGTGTAFGTASFGTAAFVGAAVFFGAAGTVQCPSATSAVMPGPNPAIRPLARCSTPPSSNSRPSASRTTALAMFPYSVSVARLNRNASGGTPRYLQRSSRMRGPPAWTM